MLGEPVTRIDSGEGKKKGGKKGSAYSGEGRKEGEDEALMRRARARAAKRGTESSFVRLVH